jgi:hypothetical protein
MYPGVSNVFPHTFFCVEAVVTACAAVLFFTERRWRSLAITVFAASLYASKLVQELRASAVE